MKTRLCGKVPKSHHGFLSSSLLKDLLYFGAVCNTHHVPKMVENANDYINNIEAVRLDMGNVRNAA
jgi:hypothetical protein